MKRLIFLFLAIALPIANLIAQQANITIKVDDWPIKSIFVQIEKSTNYTFVYSSSIIDMQQKISLNYTNEKLEVVVADLCAKANISYNFERNKIILTQKAATVTAAQEISKDKKQQIAGIISDEQGLPLAGVYVYLKSNNSIYACTDIDGTYTIEIPAGLSKTGALQVSYIGMKSAEVLIGNQDRINMTLQSDMVLDEVVLVAYGSAKKSNITGSISSVSSDKITSRPVTSVLSALSGAAPGVQITDTDGQPGFSPSIRIRGIGSYNASSDPLIVLDGVPFSGNLSAINSADIENVSILKDAASTALYGSRGANGVILIATKKGVDGPLKFNAKISQGISQRGLPDYEKVDAYEYMPLMWEALRNGYVSSGKTMAQASIDASSGGKLGIINQLGYNAFAGIANGDLMSAEGKLNPNAKLMWADDMNWNDPIERVGSRTDVTLSASIGSKKGDFMASLNYLNDAGWVAKSKYKRFSGRANANFRITSWLKVGTNLSASLNTSQNISASYPLYFASMIGPIYPIHIHDRVTGEYILDKVGNKQYDFGGPVMKDNIQYGNRPSTQGRHGIAELYWNDVNSTTLTGQSRSYMEIKFLKDFTFTANVAIDANSILSRSSMNKEVGDAAPSGSASRSHNLNLTWNYNQLLNYNKTIGKHEIGVLLGHENYEYSSEYLSGSRRNQIIPGNEELINYTTTTGLSGSTGVHRVEGYLSRITYSYDNAKYALEGSFRRDGSSKFGAESRWGNFFSVGAGWRLDKEGFMKNVKWLDLFKIRASFGQNGNDAGLSNYEWQILYDFNNNAEEPGYIQSTKPGNPDLRWETQTQIDVGAEFSLFNNRLRGSVDYFSKDATDLIFSVPLSYSTGFVSQSKNVGRMVNKGVEIDIAGTIIQNKNLTWDIRLNATTYKNKITKLPDDQKEILVKPYKRVEGGGMYDYYTYQWYGVNPDNGDGLYLFDDSGDAAAVEERWNTVLSKKYGYELDGKKVVWHTTYAKQDWCGKSALPDLYGSFSTNLRYKNFSFGVQFNYQIGGWSMDNAWNMSMSSGKYGFGKSVEIRDRWTTPGQITNVPRMDNTRATHFDATSSSRWFTSASYLMLKNVNVSYSLPSRVVKALLLNDLQVYASGENLFLISARKGFDPSRSLTAGSVHGYTFNRVITFGVNITFAN